MPLSRRDLLQLGAVASLPTVAGCSGLFPGDDSRSSTVSGTDSGGQAGSDGGSGSNAGNQSDSGRESYGIRVENRTNASQKLRITVGRPFEETTTFDETVSVDSDSSREWDSVITENVEWLVEATLLSAPDVTKDGRTENRYVTPGSAEAPDIENVHVIVRYEDDGPDEGKPTVGMRVKDVPG